MSLVTIDTETLEKKGNKLIPILDASGKSFTLGVVLKENGKSFTFYDKKEMWKAILEMGEKEFKRGKKLYCYGHNISYDFYNIAELKDSNIRWFSENPFIVSYMKEVTKRFKDEKSFKRWKLYAEIEKIRYRTEIKDNIYYIKYKKEMIKFLDSMSIYRMSLKKMGEVIGLEKLEMPVDIEGKYITKGQLAELGRYCENDCKIVMEGVKKIKKRIRDDGVHIRSLCTINQIAISYIMNEIKKKNAEHILYRKSNGEMSDLTYKTRYANEIHQSYRASLNRVWEVGVFDNVCYSDKNSLYPFSAINIDFPDLRTEEKILKPNKDVLNKIGISKVMLYNKDNEIGLIPIRAIERSYVPLSGKYIIGIYTNMEIKEALKDGYELVDIEWSINYKKGENVLKDIYNDLYKKRIESGNEFDYFFYKSLMNSSIGKFGQRKVNQEIVMDSIENIEDYLKLNGEVLRGIDGSTNVLYRLCLDDTPKKYYAPIIPCLITAYARIYMYKIFKKIGKDKLLYSDTDSIITKGSHLDKIKIGKDISEWKIEKDDTSGEELVNSKCVIWGSKAKSVGNNITVSGAFKSDLKMDEFEKGVVRSKRMMGIRNNRNEEVGKIIIEEKDLNEQKKNFLESEKMLESELVYIDKDIDDVSYFIKHINKILELRN